MSVWSMAPPRCPAAAPITTPTVRAMSIAVTPTASEIRPPSSMRAKRSWPRSSVPSGCAHEGPRSFALKSMSLMGTRYIAGPTTTATTMAKSTTAPRAASRWRRKRRNASSHSESAFVAGAAAGEEATCSVGLRVLTGLSVRNPRIEPAVQQIGDQVEQHDQARENERDCHDDGRVVGEDGADQQGPDARHPEDLLGDDRAREDGRDLQRHQGQDGNEGIAHRVLHDGRLLGESLGPGGVDVVELNYFEHGRAHEARQRGALEEAEDRHRHDGLP